MKIARRILKIIKCVILLLFLILLFLSIYINHNFNNVSFEQLLYSILTSDGTSFSSISQGLIFVLICVTISVTIMAILTKITFKIKRDIYLFIQFKRRKVFISALNLLRSLLFILFVISSSFISIKLLKLDEYIKFQLNSGTFFEDYYINPKDVNIIFPEKKQNLIYIFVESLEMTNASISNGGALEESYIPNLENIALKNINFSNSLSLGGFYSIYSTGWTAAAMIAQTSGVPQKISIDGNSYKGFSSSLPGVYSIGEILKGNGYKNYLMLGSDASFGGRKDYFEQHGDYYIYDYNYAKENEWIEQDYYEWWGYEDSKLYSFAKKELLKISEQDEPFNFTMLTADTHFIDGYVDDICPEKFDSRYANSFNCTDIMLNEFINWIKQQSFYKNTTIIIVGDHNTMQSDFYEDISADYNRTIYNAFINSKSTTDNVKNRTFTSFDLFPSTLAALGVEIEDNRLGLGTNLFSNLKTLEEEMGLQEINEQLWKKSFYYDNYLLGDSYYEMQG